MTVAGAGRVGLLDCEVVVTRNGAVAMRDRASGEVMHPMGPAVEAEAVYVGPSRLEARLREGGAPLVLFDVGLGAGSNAIAAWRVSEALPPSARRLEIVSFEHDLSALDLALSPPNASAFGFSPESADAARTLARTGRHETTRTGWRLSFGDFLVGLAGEPDASASIVFWDMFSRSVNPALWTTPTFRALRRVCREDATLHTYSAATSTRAGFLLAGFSVGTGAATGERTTTTVAAMRAEDLARPLDARWLERLDRSSAPFPLDIPNDATARAEAIACVRRHAQFRRVQSVDSAPSSTVSTPAVVDVTEQERRS